MIDSLDHVAVVSDRPDTLFQCFERLGFQLTPLSMHRGTVAPDEAPIPWGTGNRCAMLKSGYLELMAIIDPSLFCGIFPELLQRYEGLHIIAFGCADVQQERKRLTGSGIETDPVVDLQRDLETNDGLKRARFSLLRPARKEAGEGRINIIQHHTREYLWQPQLLDHPNRAVALREVVVCVEDPGEAAARYRRILGISPTQSGPVERFDLPSGRFVLVGADDLPAVVPGAAAPVMPFIAAFSVATEAPDEVRRVLENGEIPFAEKGGNLLVSARAACGTIVTFEPA